MVGEDGRDHETLPTQGTGSSAGLRRTEYHTRGYRSRHQLETHWEAEDETGVLTPAHFLIGERLTTIPSGWEPETNRSLTKEFKMRRKLADDFWRPWQKEYLTTLKSFHEVRQPQTSVRFRRGDVALLQEDVRPRHMWKTAIIERVIEGRDGRIRTVALRTSEGNKITRPIQLVIPLEVDQGGEDVEECLSS